MLKTKFYYLASVKNGRDFVQGIPIFAFTEGDSYARGWNSNRIEGKGGLKAIAERVSGTRLISLAIPQIFANQKFSLKQEFERMNIYAFTAYDDEKNVFTTTNISMSIHDISVYRKQPLDGWKDLPEPRGINKKWLEENVPNWSLPIGVTLFVKDGQANASD